MKAIVELLITGWFALGIFKVFALTILGAAFIACVRQRDLTSGLWMGLLLLLPLAFFSGLLPLSWKALPHVPKAVAETFLKPAAQPLPLPALQSTPGAEDDLLLEPGHAIMENIASSVPMAIMKPSNPSLSSGEWLLCLWISGGVITLLPAILSSLASRRLRRSPATPEMSSLWAGLAGDTADFVPLRISCDVETPGVTSALRPEVILPVSALDWEKSQLASVLHHELHHIARHDLLFRSLGLLARAVLWFHPAAWWIQSRLVLAQEQAADEAVLASGIPATDYATHLLDVAVSARTFPGIAMARRSQLGGRIRLLLAKRSSLSAMRKRAEFLFAAAMALVAVAVLPLGFAAGDSAGAADEPIATDHGDRPPILDRNGAVIATSDPARMPDSLRGIPPVRWYPGGEMLAPVSGYIFRDIRGGTVVGKGTGLEDSESLADGRVLHSSIDIRIQRLAWAALQKRELPGSVIVMDPHSGEVLAMASWPSFDPNRLAAGLTLEEWAALDNDPRQLFLNRATLPEAPGSLAKLLVALAAAKADKADRVIHCGPSYQIGSVTIRDWNLNRNEDLDLSRALGSSCNTYFIPLALELGPEAIAVIGMDFGFGIETALPWRERATWYGIAPTDGKPTDFDLALAAIGQSRCKYSLLDSARIVSSIASGQIRPPIFTLGETIPEAVSFESLGIDDRELGLIRTGMIASVDMLVPAVRETGLSGTIVGKTSTARAGTEKYSVNFAGYAPADAPRFVVAVRFTAEAKDQPSGGIIAGSVAADLMKSLLNSGF